MIKEIFKRVVSGAVLIATCVGLSLGTNAAEPDCIYYREAFNYSNPQYPTEDNASYYENYKLLETQPGSKIYEGRFWITSKNFVFHTALTPTDLYHEYTDLANYTDVIIPENEGWPYEVAMDVLGKSKVCRAALKYYKFNKNADYAFTIPGFKEPGYYKFRVDMNTNMVYVAAQDAVVVLVNDESIPTPETAANYVSYSEFNRYIPSGDMKFRLYDFSNSWWIGADTQSPELEELGYNVLLPNNASLTPSAFYNVDGWTGGVLSFADKREYNFVANILPDVAPTPKNFAGGKVWVVGDFCGWDFSKGLEVSSAAGNDKLFKFTIPAGTQGFRILSEANWGGITFSPYGSPTASADGGIVYQVISNSNYPHYAFTDPTKTPISATFDANAMTLTLGSAAAAYVPAAAEEDCMYLISADSDFKLWKGAPETVLNSFTKLTKTSDGVYEGTATLSSLNGYIVTALTAKGTPNTVLCPSTACSLEVVGGIAYSSAITSTDDKANLWTYDGWEGGDVKIQVNTTTTPAKVKFTFLDERINPCLYFVGAAQQWVEPTEDKKDYFEDWKLRLTDKGGFYGSFEIPSGQAEFRFYRELAGWSGESIGCQYEGNPVDYEFVDGMTTDYYYGKGYWNFTNWTGGTLYIYVGATTVTFSKSPIAAAGTIVGDDVETYKESMYVYNGGEYDELSMKSDGVYYGYVYVEDESADLRFFTKHLPMTENEAAWAGSYALSAPSDGFTFAFDEYGVAEATYTQCNEVSSTPANAFRVVKEQGHNTLYYITIDTNKKKIYVENGHSKYYLVGGLTDNKVPTYETRQQFKNVMIDDLGGFVDVPAGKFDFSYYRLSSGASTYQDLEIVFNEYGVTPNGWWLSDLYQFHCVKTDWEGGRIYITPNKMAKADSIDKLYVYITGNDSKPTIAETAPGSLVFSGTVDYDASNTSYGLELRFYVGDPSEDEKNGMAIASAYVYTNGGYCNQGLEYLHFDGGRCELPLGSSQSSFLSNALVGKGKLKLTVDLNAMKLTAELVEGKEEPTYQLVSTDDDFTVKPSQYKSGVATGVGYFDSGNLAFNFTSSTGSIIAPATDTQLTFDDYGMWTGPYTEYAANTVNASDLRLKATAKSKWSFVNKDDGCVHFMINTNDKTLTVLSSAHNKTFFAYSYSAMVYKVVPKIEFIDELKKEVLVETSPGVYQGRYELPEGETVYLRISSSLQATIGPRSSYDSTFEINDENTEATMLANYEWYTNSWKVKSTSRNVVLKLDLNEYTFTIGKDFGGVNAVTTESGLTIIPGQGCIKILSQTRQTLPIYSVSGMLVKTVAVGEGVTTVDIPAGLYIANRTKVVVR
ncbi:MAG: hypothetical protein ACI31A_08675 [Candidatus Limisoma sp.]